jgi:Fanconi anemia group M protein
MERLKKLQIQAHNKRDLVEAQQSLQKRLQKEKNPIMYHQISAIAEALKLWYAVELLETQSLSATLKYLEGMGTGSKAAKRIMQDLRIKLAWEQIRKIKDEGGEHPKMERLCELVKDEIAANKNVQLIIFSHYRNNIEQIWRKLKGVDGCLPVVLIGQGGETGMSQKEQIEIIRDLESGIYNCLITSSIGEEGLSIEGLDIAIFYDSVPSAIRLIQRRGRVARTRPGKAIFLLTKDTQDEAYFWKSRREESKMRDLLRSQAAGQATIDSF